MTLSVPKELPMVLTSEQGTQSWPQNKAPRPWYFSNWNLLLINSSIHPSIHPLMQELFQSLWYGNKCFERRPSSYKTYVLVYTSLFWYDRKLALSCSFNFTSHLCTTRLKSYTSATLPRNPLCYRYNLLQGRAVSMSVNSWTLQLCNILVSL